MSTPHEGWVMWAGLRLWFGLAGECSLCRGQRPVSGQGEDLGSMGNAAEPLACVLGSP